MDGVVQELMKHAFQEHPVSLDRDGHLGQVTAQNDAMGLAVSLMRGQDVLTERWQLDGRALGQDPVNLEGRKFLDAHDHGQQPGGAGVNLAHQITLHLIECRGLFECCTAGNHVAQWRMKGVGKGDQGSALGLAGLVQNGIALSDQALLMADGLQLVHEQACGAQEKEQAAQDEPGAEGRSGQGAIAYESRRPGQ